MDLWIVLWNSPVNGWKNAEDNPAYLILTNHRLASIGFNQGAIFSFRPVNFVLEHQHTFSLAEINELRLTENAIVVSGEVFRPYGGGVSCESIFDEIQKSKLRLTNTASTEYERPTKVSPSSAPRELVVITREIVKIPCRYCGMLNLQSDLRCVGCGAPTK